MLKWLNNAQQTSFYPSLRCFFDIKDGLIFAGLLNTTPAAAASTLRGTRTESRATQLDPLPSDSVRIAAFPFKYTFDLRRYLND